MAEATWREWLDEAGFDWGRGVILWEEVGGRLRGWSAGEGVVEIDTGHEILDEEFGTGFGSPEAPRIVAYDADKIYFPEQYDGAVSLSWVYRDPDDYVQSNNSTPYPGE